MRLVGYVAGGRPGQRLLERLSIAVSNDTVLRRIRQKPELEPSVLPIRNLGVDDWAWRKGQDYGTILVNLDLHGVVKAAPGPGHRRQPATALNTGWDQEILQRTGTRAVR